MKEGVDYRVKIHFKVNINQISAIKQSAVMVIPLTQYVA